MMLSTNTFSLAKRRVLAIAMLVIAMVAGGCNIMAYPLYLIMPDLDKKKVPAEFTFPEGSTVAVVVFANMDAMFEYPFIRQELSSAVEGEFKRNLPDIKIVNYDQVIRYQESNVYWSTQPVSSVGRAVQADYVLYISVNSFSTYEHGSISLPRGLMDASACVIAVPKDESGAKGDVVTSVADETPWQKAVISVDEDASTGPLFENQRMLRQVVQLRFAQRLVRAFYKYTPESDN